MGDDYDAKKDELKSKYNSIPADKRERKTDLVMKKELIILRKKCKDAWQRCEELERNDEYIARHKDTIQKSQEYLAVKQAEGNISDRRDKIRQLKKAALKKELESLNLDIGEMRRRREEANVKRKHFMACKNYGAVRLQMDTSRLLSGMIKEAEQSIGLPERGSIPAESLTVSDLKKFHVDAADASKSDS